MSPYDQRLIEAYCDRTDVDDDFPYREDVDWIAGNIDRMKLRFAVVSVDYSNVIHERLLDSAVAATQAMGTTRAEVAAVLTVNG
jgi:hypothetical protein